MARISGARGRLYAAITSAGTAAPIAFLSELSFDMSTEQFEVTAFEDTTKTYVAGKPDAKGTYKGFYDTSVAGGQFYAAATDGVARKFYVYEDCNTLTSYFFGTGFFDQKLGIPMNGAVTLEGSITPATPLCHSA